MFTVQVRDHIMIAHSFKDPFFGPAQKMHGATYVIDVTFATPELNKHNVVAKSADFFDGKIKVVLGESHVAWAGYEGS